MAQISNIKVIGLMVEFLKIVKLWHLSIEFYGEWQKVATHHRTQYLTWDPTLRPWFETSSVPILAMDCLSNLKTLLWLQLFKSLPFHCSNNGLGTQH